MPLVLVGGYRPHIALHHYTSQLEAGQQQFCPAQGDIKAGAAHHGVWLLEVDDEFIMIPNTSGINGATWQTSSGGIPSILSL